MLSRTADHLYWMARYTERAENTARMLDVNWQMSLLPRPAPTAERSWRAMLDISELTAPYLERHGRVTADAVLDFMVSDPVNPSSIVSCLRLARENARAVRGSLFLRENEFNIAQGQATFDGSSAYPTFGATASGFVPSDAGRCPPRRRSDRWTGPAWAARCSPRGARAAARRTPRARPAWRRARSACRSRPRRGLP